jgi:hypothetical protein
MATPTWVPLAETTTSSNATSVTISNLAGYRDFVMVLDNCKTNSGGENIYMTINGDTNSSNYVLRTLRAINTNAQSTTRTDAASRILGYDAGPSSTNATQAITEFIGAGATDRYKSILSKNTNAKSYSSGMTITTWQNTNAITSIKVEAETTYFQDGMTVAIYGVDA